MIKATLDNSDFLLAHDLGEYAVTLTGDIDGEAVDALYGVFRHENGTYVFYPDDEFSDYSVDYQTNSLSEALESLEEDVNANQEEVAKEIGL